ncbi:uncharacterized protein LOC143594728 [Bidens hawaiensis]|uniref:uncharacterized protein LOC143594728 n=1 Tax=Bidens hawaiensis TaxID=980011 RepID=UPI00404AC037
MDLYDILFGDGNVEHSCYAYNDQLEQSGLPDLNELPDLNHEPGYENIEPYDLPNPDQYFNSVAELVDWVKKTGREHGCVISVQRSRNKSVELNSPGDCWKLEVVNETHNHEPVLFEEGHPALRKLTDEEIDMVATLHRQGLKPAKIKSAIKQRFPDNKCITRDIYNVIKLVDDQDKIGDTPMQVLENFLQTRGFTFYTWENPSTNRKKNTYNTNMYKWPYVQFVGVTSTSKSFCIAYAVIFREQECNFTWVLE